VTSERAWMGGDIPPPGPRARYEARKAKEREESKERDREFEEALARTVGSIVGGVLLKRKLRKEGAPKWALTALPGIAMMSAQSLKQRGDDMDLIAKKVADLVVKALDKREGRS